MVYVEPFVGGANTFCRVPQADGPRIGADVNKYMIALHKALATGWQPPITMTKEQYTDIKNNNDKYPPELVAFAATGCSFGSLWFNTFVVENEVDGGFVTEARAKAEGMQGNRCGQSARACLRDAPGLIGATFINCSYEELEIPPESLIYCDPPYISTQGYEGASRVIEIGDSGAKNIWRAYKFWQWADRMVEAGHTVFVSEYTGPPSSAYRTDPTPEQAAEIKVLAEDARAKQRDLKVSGDVVQAAVDKWQTAASKVKDVSKLVNRWKVVWQKEVSVNINAIGVDVEARKEMERELVEVDAAILSSEVPDEKVVARAAELRKLIVAAQSKKETEKLFHREA